VIAPASQQGPISGSVQPTLRDYQRSAIAAVRRELAVHRSTLVVAATGTGKTVTFAELARIEVSHGGRALILVHRDELIRQAGRKCEAVGLWPDVECGSRRANTLAKVVIASVQTLRGKRLARWARAHFTLVIVDEAHHAVANSYRAVLDYFDGAKIVGVTATPNRADGVGLIEVFASVAYRYEIRQAIAEGFLVPIVARRVVVESIDLDAVAMRAGDFAQDQLAKVMADERAIRGVVTPFLELAADRQSIGFCVDVAHAHAVAAAMNKLRHGCARAVDGKTDDDEREYLLAAHAGGEFQFLMNCDLLVEGYDAPSVSCVAMIRPTKSHGRFIQCAGRGLRPSPETGKRDCLLLDLTGTGSKHQLVGPVDCLTGSPNEIPDDVREEIDRQLSSAQRPIDAVLEHADREVAKRRDALRISAVVKYTAEFVDPFIGAESSAAPPCDPSWEKQPPSERQIEMLESKRFGVTTSHLPPAFSRADAWRLLHRLNTRNDGTLCTYKQARRLASAGVGNTASLSRERANELCTKLRIGKWLPGSIAGEPEVVRERKAS
jgi:superfamily II DNA or RNA helicase